MHDVHFSVHINCLTSVGTEHLCGSQASSMRRSHLVSFGFAVLPVLHSSLSGEEPFDGSTVHMQDVVGFEKRALIDSTPIQRDDVLSLHSRAVRGVEICMLDVPPEIRIISL